MANVAMLPALKLRTLNNDSGNMGCLF